MPRKSRKSPEKLPQRKETWHAYAWKTHFWIDPPDEEPYRPFALMVLNLDRHLIQGVEILDAQPSIDDTYDALVNMMMTRDRSFHRKKGRPARIRFEDPNLIAGLSDRLEALGIRAVQAEHLELLDSLIKDMESHMGGPTALPGLLTVEGVTPELAGGFFAAAAAVYRAAPWERISDEHKFSVTVPPESDARFLTFMGFAGIEYGVATYLRWEDVERIYASTDPEESIPDDGMRSIFFYDRLESPIDDMEAASRYGWELAGDDAYPVPLVFFPEEEDEGVRRPSRDDLVWYEAAFLAILQFIDRHLDETAVDEFRAAEVDIPVATHAGEIVVHVKYPGAVISPELKMKMGVESPHIDEDARNYTFDRRLIESTLRDLGGGFDDPNLNEAQDLMYQAWEEASPRRRIALARQALKISPDCADAYVLLAEEEAGSPGKAREYYEAALEAGKRALGESFDEYSGDFWMVLETRPYMRARQGLAGLLWSLGEKEEAAGHFRAMLELNPNDNQGNRYALASLLLDMERDQEVIALMDEYPEDGSAEFTYTRVLMVFRREGATAAARAALEQALEMNAHVPAYLVGKQRVPPRPSEYITLGGESEAASYASEYLRHWRRTRGALDWLKESAGLGTEEKRKKRTKRGRRGSKRRNKP